MQAFFKPHRIVLLGIGLLLVVLAVTLMNWSWLANPKYQTLIMQGIWRSIWLTFVTMAIGMTLAIPIGLAQAVGPWYLAIPARIFCTVIRGTPLLMQIWLLYYGLGSLFPGIPGIRDSVLWPILRQAWPYAVVALSLSVAGYEGEVMRGAFKGVPHGQLESAKSGLKARDASPTRAVIAFNVLVSPKGHRAFVGNTMGSTLIEIDTATNQVLQTIKVPAGPNGMTFTPDGDNILMTNVYAGRLSSYNLSMKVVNEAPTSACCRVSSGSLPMG